MADNDAPLVLWHGAHCLPRGGKVSPGCPQDVSSPSRTLRTLLKISAGIRRAPWGRRRGTEDGKRERRGCVLGGGGWESSQAG